VSLVDDLMTARTTARDAADQLVTRAAEEERDLSPEELGEYQDHLGEEREAADRIEQLRDDQIRELRAATARVPDEPPSMGEMLMRSISEASGAGSAFTPSEYANSFFDKLSAAATFLQTGVNVLTTDRDSLVVPRWKSDTTSSWVSEGNAITSTSADADTVTATPRKLAALETITNETLADSQPSIYEAITAGLVRSMALEADRAFYYGTGVAPQPRGLANTAGVQFQATGAPEPDDFANAIEKLLSANATPGAVVMGARAWGDLIRTKELTSGSNKSVMQDSAGSASDAVRPAIFGVPI
jgi:HK97 family phage major capsid protein